MTRRLSSVAAWVAMAAGLSCGGDGGGTGDHTSTIAARVYWAGPVSNARVEAWQILPGGAQYQDHPITEGTTDASGNVLLDIGLQGNIIELRAYGGSFDDPATGTRVTLDSSVRLRGYQQHILDEDRTGAIVSPVTSLQADLADARRAAHRVDSDMGDNSIDRARALLGAHLLDINAENTTPADVYSASATPATSPTAEVRYGLVLAGMSLYASDIASASGLTVQDFNITHLVAGLSADLTSSEILFDGHKSEGHTPDAFVRVGACPAKPLCAGADFDAKPECRTACDLFANSPRAYLARALLAWLGDTARNKSGISPDDLRSRLEQMAANPEPNLFSATTPEPLLNEGPAITFTSPSGTVAGLVDIKATATSPVGVKSLTVTWDATTPGPALVDSNPDPAVFEVHSFDTTQLGDAAWTLTASATDSLGNLTENVTHTFTVDNIGSGTVSGVAWKGPIASATVRVFKFAGGVRGALLGSGTTDASGVFTNLMLAQGYSGPIEIVVGKTGTYTEEASPVQVTLDVDNELRTVLPAYTDGQAVGQVVVTPLTSFAAALLDWKVAHAGATPNIPALWAEAVGVMQSQFDVPDIEHLTPTAPTSISSLSGGARYSLALIGLSQRALQVSSNRPAGTGDAGSFPTVMNSLVATAKLEQDLRADGCWDGKAGATDLLYGGTTKLSASDTRINLASAIVAYVQGTENQTPFHTAGDLLGMLDALSLGGTSTGTGGCLGGGVYPDDGTVYDQVGPTVTFGGTLDPFVRGTITVSAVGDDHGIDLKPSTFIQREASPNPVVLSDKDGDSTDADATVDIDTVALGEGPQTLTAKSTDDSGNVGTAQHAFIVDNLAPVLSVVGVQNGDTYADNRVITFTQSDANPGTTTATLAVGAGAPQTFQSGAQVTADGAYTLVVNGTDKAGNAAAPLTVAFTINRSAPIITVTGVEGGKFYNGARTISFSATPAGSTVTAELDQATFQDGGTVSGEGVHALKVTATSPANLTSTTTLTFTIDTIKPVILVGGVENGKSYKDTFITYTQMDTNADVTIAKLNTVQIPSPYHPALEDEYTLVVTATDKAGNVATPVTIAFSIDRTAPTIAIAGVANGQYYNAARTITYTAPGEAHLATLTATLDGTSFLSGGGASADKDYHLVVTASDTAGNSSTQVVDFVIDTIKPVLGYTGFTNGQFVKQDVTIGLTQNDAHPGVIIAKLDGVDYPGGTAVSSELPSPHTLVLNTTDLAGNIATPVTATFTIDKTAPTITVGGVSNNAYYNTSKSPTFALSEAGTISATLDGTTFMSGSVVSAEGPHTLVVNGADKAGNAASPVTIVFTIDTMAPTISVVGPGVNNGVANNGAYNSNRTLAWNLSEAGTTTATLTNVTLGGTQTLANPSSITAVQNVEATYRLVITGSDLAGNAATPVDITFAVDAKPPVITVTGVSAGAFYSGPRTISFSQADLRPGTTTATLGGSTFLPGTTVSTQGAYTLHVDAVDAAGNTSMVDIGFVIDTTAPNVTITGVTEGTWYPTAVAPIVAISDTYLQSQAVTLDGAAYTSGTSITAQGAHTLTAIATDKAGTSTTKTVHFTVDTTPPTIAWDPTTPLAGAQLNASFNVIASASDNLSLTAFGMSAPTGQSDIATALESVYVTLSPAALGDQDLTVTLTAQDQAGGTTTASRTYVLDTTKPTLTPSTTGFIAVQGTLWAQTTAVNLTGTATDAHLAKVTVSKSATLCGSSTASSWSIPLSACLAAGSNALVVTAVDVAGNQASIDVTVGVDAGAPSVTVANSSVIDESADTVATLSGTSPQAPVHTHSTDPANIPDLDGSSCANPVTLKLYAYLHDQGGAPYGTETSPNPFKWTFTSADAGAGIDASSNPTQYRVSYWDATNTTQTVLVDWATLSGTTNPDSSITYALTLFRKLAGGSTARPALPELGTLERKFQIDFRTVDRLGNSKTETHCWNNRPLAAPLSIQAAQVASTTNNAASGRVALTNLKLNGSAVTSPSVPTYILNNGGPGAGLTEFTITNMTAEPVYVQLTLTPPTAAPTHTMTAQRAYVETAYAPHTIGLTCASVSDPKCVSPSSLAKSAPSTSGPIAAPTYAIRVFDTTNTEMIASVCSGCAANQYLLGARTATKPSSYLVQSAIQTISEMRPTGTSGTYSDLKLPYYASSSATTTTTLWITGQTFSTTTACDDVVFVPNDPNGLPAHYECKRTGTYLEYVAIGGMTMSYSLPTFGTTIDATVAVGATTKSSVVRTGNGSSTVINTSQALPALP